MPENIPSDTQGLGELVRQHLIVLSHDVVNVQDTVRRVEAHLDGLATRVELSKTEALLEKITEEVSLNRGFINGIKGTLGVLKVVVAAISSFFVMLIGTLVSLHQQDMSELHAYENRATKEESKVDFVVSHQVAELVEFKREVEEQGSPILRNTVRDLSALQLEVRENKAEVKNLATAWLDYFTRNRTRPDIEDAKH
jgi:hypothetical protein